MDKAQLPARVGVVLAALAAFQEPGMAAAGGNMAPQETAAAGGKAVCLAPVAREGRVAGPVKPFRVTQTSRGSPLEHG